MTDYNPNRGDARPSPTVEEEVFSQYPPATWAPDDGQVIVFPVEDIQESGGARLVRRERPYRKGAKLDNTGRTPFVWRFTSKFNNSIREEGLEQNGAPLYPDVLNRIIETFDSKLTGDLLVPTRGMVRARAERYDRRETSSNNRNGAFLTIIFVEDNEDDVDSSSVGAPSVNATAVQIAADTQFSADQQGFDTGSLQDWRHAMAQIESLVSAPREYVRDLQETARIIFGTTEKLLRTHQSNADWTKQQFKGHEGNRMERLLLKGSDRAAQVQIQAQQNQPKKRGVVFEQDQSLASISAMLGVQYEDLLYMNPQLANPMYIPKGTLVYVEENATLARHG